MKRALSPVHDQEKIPEQSSHKAQPQISHSPPIKEDATESEVESLQYDKNKKPQKKGRHCIDISSHDCKLMTDLSCMKKP